VARGLDAIHARHTNIHQHNVRIPALRHAERFDPVDSLTDELVLSKLANHPRETITRRFFIVDYQYLHAPSIIGILSFTV
jgi:hypothetical protein